jgi:Alpha galactosidase C-terminal beta sandwich domain
VFPLFSSITSSAFLNHLAVYVMPGEGMEVGSHMSVEEATSKRPRVVLDTIRERESPVTGIGTTTAEARTVVSWVALTGVVYPLASVMPEVPQERLELLHKTLPTMPILPVDLFSRGSDIGWDTFKHTTPDTYIHHYPEILDLKVNAPAGVYDVAAFTNWRSQPAPRSVSLAEKLGLSDNDDYVAFDFWNQKLLGVFRNKIEVAVEPHDTRVLLIHRVTGHPQLVGMSRHITGAFSLESYQWDAAWRRLSGVSQAIAGARYALTVYVPGGHRFLRAAATSGGKAVAVASAQTRNAVTVSFPGQSGKVEWNVWFGR